MDLSAQLIDQGSCLAGLRSEGEETNRLRALDETGFMRNVLPCLPLVCPRAPERSPGADGPSAGQSP